MPFSAPTPRLSEALSEYYGRKNNLDIPNWRFSMTGFYIPEGKEVQPCCQDIPVELLWWHMHSVIHVAHLYGVDPRDLMEAIASDRAKWLKLPITNDQMSDLRIKARDHLPDNYRKWYDLQVSHARAVSEQEEPLPWGVS